MPLVTSACSSRAGEPGHHVLGGLLHGPVQLGLGEVAQQQLAGHPGERRVVAGGGQREAVAEHGGEPQRGGAGRRPDLDEPRPQRGEVGQGLVHVEHDHGRAHVPTLPAPVRLMPAPGSLVGLSPRSACPPRPRSRCRRCRRASPRAARRGAGCPAGRAGCRARPPGTARPGRARSSSSSSSASEETSARSRRSSPPAAKPLRYHDDVLAELLAAPLLPHVLARAARRGGASSRPPRRASAGSRPRSPANAAARSRNSHGRPRQPRPTTTPAAPVSLDHPQRVGGLPDVAVAEHRDVDVRDQLARSRPSRPRRSSACATVRPCSAIAAQPDSCAIRPASR